MLDQDTYDVDILEPARTLVYCGCEMINGAARVCRELGTAERYRVVPDDQTERTKRREAISALFRPYTPRTTELSVYAAHCECQTVNLHFGCAANASFVL